MGYDDSEVSASLHPGLCGLRPGLREVAGIARILGGVKAAKGEVGGLLHMFLFFQLFLRL